EGRRRERERRAIAAAEHRAPALASGSGPTAGHLEKRAARIDADDPAPRSHARRRVTRHDAGPAADVEDPHAGPDAGQRQERLAKPRLMRLAAAGLEDDREPTGVGLPVDRPVRIDGAAPAARPRSGFAPGSHDRAAYRSAQAALQK